MTPAIDALLKEVDEHDREATPAPWQVTLSRGDGMTQMMVRQHTAPSIAVGREFWPDSPVAEAATDEDRYLQPDALCELPGGKERQARLIAAYRTAAPRLAAIVRVLKDALAAAPCSCQRKGDRILYGDGYQGYSDVKEDVTCDIHAALLRAEEIASKTP